MFIKEFSIYVDYLQKEIKKTPNPPSPKEKKYLTSFISNLLDGVDYYEALFFNSNVDLNSSAPISLVELNEGRKKIIEMRAKLIA